LSISKAILTGIRKAYCVAYTNSGTLTVEDSQNLLFITTYMTQSHNIANINKEIPDGFPPTHVGNEDKYLTG
jgi:homoserine acetyltransferase